MATWLAHLRIAELLVGQFGFDKGAFYAGNIGADCGLPSADGFQPPKEITHWAAHKSECDYMRFKTEYIDNETDPLRLSFYWGYFAHLMTDCLWCSVINSPTKEKFSALYAADREEFYRLVKRDWYDNDFLFLEQHPDHPPLKILRDAVLPRDLLPYYKDDNIAVQQKTSMNSTWAAVNRSSTTATAASTATIPTSQHSSMNYLFPPQQGRYRRK